MNEQRIPKINITVTTFDRANLLMNTLPQSLKQNYPYGAFTVTVIDDGSTDETARLMEKFFALPNFCYVKLARNINSYQAKNLSLLVSDYDAITFHDSDDIPDASKINLQARSLFAPAVKLSSVDPRALNGYKIKDAEVCLSGCVSVYPDGSQYLKNNPLSLFSDVFPQAVLNNIDRANLIAPINHALFRKSLFERLGGFINAAMSADRELQSRMVLTDTAIKFLSDVLYTKFKYEDSLTISEDTNMSSAARIAVHEEVYRRIAHLRTLCAENFPNCEHIETIHIPDLEIEGVSRPELLTFNQEIPVTEETKNLIFRQLERFQISNSIAGGAA